MQATSVPLAALSGGFSWWRYKCGAVRSAFKKNGVNSGSSGSAGRLRFRFFFSFFFFSGAANGIQLAALIFYRSERAQALLIPLDATHLCSTPSSFFWLEGATEPLWVVLLLLSPPAVFLGAFKTPRLLNGLLFFFFGRGFHYRPSSAAPPPKKQRASLSQAPKARSLRLSPSRSTACRRDPRRRRTQHPSCYLRQASPPPSPDPLACDLQLASVAVSAARRDSASSHPGTAYFSLPRRTCVCARHTTAPQPPSAAACGTSAPRLPPRGFRRGIDPPSHPPLVSPC
jgi:hypothetical protein